MWLAIDVGNSAVKMGLFSPADLNAAALPSPLATFRLDRLALDWDALHAWLPSSLSHAFVTTVCPPVSDELVGWWNAHRAHVPLTVLANADLPLAVRVQHPERVGTDRLVAAVAAGRRKHPARGAIVVDAGSATTVDLVGVSGEFLGGAILPGIRLQSQSLTQGTAQLPPIEWNALEAARERLPVVGKTTTQAIQSGVAWGLVGAVRELMTRISYELSEPPDLFFTGGDGPWLARQLAVHAVVEPDLVLQGIAWAGHARMQRGDSK